MQAAGTIFIRGVCRTGQKLTPLVHNVGMSCLRHNQIQYPNKHD